MSAQVTAVNAVVKDFGRKLKKDGEAKLRFELTAAILSAFDWPEVPEAVSEWEPSISQLVCSFIELTPNKTNLNGKVICRVECKSLSSFQIQRKALKVGKNAVKAEKKITSVLCTATFGDPLGCAKLEQYAMSGAVNSEMCIGFEPAPIQDELPGTRVDVVSGEVHATPEQRQAVLDMPADEGNRPTHAEKVRQKREESAKLAELRKGIR